MGTTKQEKWYNSLWGILIIQILAPYISTTITYIIKGVSSFHWFQNLVVLITQFNSINISLELILSSIGSILFLSSIVLLVVVKKPSRDVADIIAPFLINGGDDNFNKKWKLYKSFYILRIILLVGATALFISALII